MVCKMFYVLILYGRLEAVLVATLDGTLSLVEIDWLKFRWSIKTGEFIHPIKLQNSNNLDLNLDNASGLQDGR